MENHRISNREVAEDVAILACSGHVFSNVLDIKPIYAKFASKFLIFDQKIPRLSVTQELLDDVNNNIDLSKSAIAAKYVYMTMTLKVKCNLPNGCLSRPKQAAPHVQLCTFCTWCGTPPVLARGSREEIDLLTHRCLISWPKSTR